MKKRDIEILDLKQTQHGQNLAKESQEKSENLKLHLSVGYRNSIAVCVGSRQRRVYRSMHQFHLRQVWQQSGASSAPAVRRSPLRTP